MGVIQTNSIAKDIFVRVQFKQLIFKMMKLAVLALCLIAAVVAEPEAEASSEASYGSYGYGLGYRGYGYGGYYGHGYGYGYPYHGYGYGYAGYRGKRSADADPAVFYGAYAPYGYGCSIRLCPIQISRCCLPPTRKHPSCHLWSPPIAQA